MNTNKKNHAVRIIAVFSTAVMFLIGSPMASFANAGGARKAATATNAQVSVTYQGVTNNDVVFKVDYENPTGEKFWLVIKNDNGDVVFSQQFDDVHFSKNVRFLNTDADINPTFIVRTANSDVVREFQVNNIIPETTMVTGL
ncbi:MAG TPA: hypothetical protein VKU83_05690 [Puia sp.]|nr:hypothetical protein [Puia sp.]